MLFFLAIIALQGALEVLLPRGISAPDLFLLTALILAARLPPTWGMLAAYGVGLTQDILGHGLLGLHAAALAGGTLLFYGVRQLLNSNTPLHEAAGIVVAVAGQWATFLILTYWLRSNLVTVSTLTLVLPLHLLLTLLIFPLVYRAGRWAFGRIPSTDDQLA
nr:Rod shape-determining protein MreD [Deinobacterium chartae]